MIVVDVQQAQADLARLIERAAEGEEIVVTEAGTPVARILAYDPGPPRKPGLLAGQIVIEPDFDDLPPEFRELAGT